MLYNEFRRYRCDAGTGSWAYPRASHLALPCAFEVGVWYKPRMKDGQTPTPCCEDEIEHSVNYNRVRYLLNRVPINYEGMVRSRNQYDPHGYTDHRLYPPADFFS